jgi:hypothetical protein
LALSVRVDDALPPAGTVTGLEIFTLTPDGAVPTQVAARLMDELNPFSEDSVIVVDLETLRVSVIMAGESCVVKSGFGVAASRLPEGVTINWRVAECDRPPLDAVTVNW